MSLGVRLHSTLDRIDGQGMRGVLFKMRVRSSKPISRLIALHLLLAVHLRRARLESLAALFDVPSPAAAQLLLRHPALAAIPPNVTITRAKQLSIALRCSMARAGELIAKVGHCLRLCLCSVFCRSVRGSREDGGGGATVAALSTGRTRHQGVCAGEEDFQ